MTEQELLDSWRAAIAATKAAEEAHDTALDLDGNTHLTGDALDDAAWEEVRAARAYLAARDASVASQVTCSETGPGVADFEGIRDG